MTRYAVAFTDEYDERLSIVIVEADTWQEALSKHPVFTKSEDTFEENFGTLSDDLQTAKDDFCGMDMEFDIVEIKDE